MRWHKPRRSPRSLPKLVPAPQPQPLPPPRDAAPGAGQHLTPLAPHTTPASRHPPPLLRGPPCERCPPGPPLCPRPPCAHPPPGPTPQRAAEGLQLRAVPRSRLHGSARLGPDRLPSVGMRHFSAGRRGRRQPSADRRLQKEASGAGRGSFWGKKRPFGTAVPVRPLERRRGGCPEGSAAGPGPGAAVRGRRAEAVVREQLR